MDHDTPREVDTSLAAHAFGELRAEVSLLRRAVERLTDERISQPDYAPSLEAISNRLEDVCTWARRVSEKPALQLTPDTMAKRMDAAAATSRANDRQMLTVAASSLEAAGTRMDAMIARVRSADAQDRELLHNRIAFAVAGMLVWAILPGAVARSLPVSWAVPERIAARMLGTDMWNAGQVMMAKADAKRWGQIVAAEQGRAKQEQAK